MKKILFLIPLLLTCRVEYGNNRYNLVRFDYDVRLDLVDDNGNYLQAQYDDIQRDIDRFPGGLTFLILSCNGYDREAEEIARSLSLRNNVILAEHNDC